MAWGEDELEATDDMEEPVPCPRCGYWVELQDCRTCAGCRDLCCGNCLHGGRCSRCIKEATGKMPKKKGLTR